MCGPSRTTRPVTFQAPCTSIPTRISPRSGPTQRSVGGTPYRATRSSSRSSRGPESVQASSCLPSTTARAGPRAAGGCSAISATTQQGRSTSRGYLGPLSTEAVVPAPGDLRARPREDDTVTAEEILSRLGDPSLVLLDARSRTRWLGDEEPLDPVAGRIPGSINTPFAEPLPEGAAAASGLVSYCGSGVTACVTAQRLVLAGRDDVRLYPGSFSEWCRREGYPIEKGTP